MFERLIMVSSFQFVIFLLDKDMVDAGNRCLKHFENHDNAE